MAALINRKHEPSTPPAHQMAAVGDAGMEMIENLPLGELSSTMAASIASEFAPPAGGGARAPPAPAPVAPPAAAAPSGAAPVSGTSQRTSGLLQQLYEQQQIFAYHAQQAQQAHLNCSAMIQRFGGDAAGAETLRLQMQRLAALRETMLSLQRSAAGAPAVPTAAAAAGGAEQLVGGEKRGADDFAAEQGAAKRQREEPAAGGSVVVVVAGSPGESAAAPEVPVYTEDATGLGLPVAAVRSGECMLAPAPRIHALPAEILELDPTAHTYTPLINPETGLAIGQRGDGQAVAVDAGGAPAAAGGAAAASGAAAAPGGNGVKFGAANGMPSQWIKRPWTEEQDQQLREAIAKFGARNWSSVSEMIPTKNGKQCRERWINHIDPAINREPWTHEDDMSLIEAHSRLGNRWTELGAFRSCLTLLQSLGLSVALSLCLRLSVSDSLLSLWVSVSLSPTLSVSDSLPSLCLTLSDSQHPYSPGGRTTR